MTIVCSAQEAAPVTMFIYTPLSNASTHVRLISIQPGEESDAIQISIIDAPLDSKPEFVALSYAWGEPHPHAMNGIGQYTIAVAENLYNALKMLRRNIKTRLCWIDALCINQDDAIEKASQLPLMRRIYREAELVVIYVGEEQDGSENLPTLCGLIASAYMQFKGIDGLKVFDPVKLDLGFPAMDKRDMIRLGLPAPSDAIWDAFRQFLQRAWFHRLWVIQEAVLASNSIIICGGWSAKLVGLFNVIVMGYNIGLPLAQGRSDLPDHENTLWRTIRHVMHMLRLGAGQPKVTAVKLVDLLPLLQTALVSDPRDYVFALLGLSHDLELPDLKIEHSMPVEVIYIQVANALVRQGDGYKMLLSADGQKLKLPSWVPDWSWGGYKTAEMAPLHRIRSPPETVFRLHFDYANILLARGFLIDHVVECGLEHNLPSFSDEHWKAKVLEKLKPDYRRRQKLLATVNDSEFLSLLAHYFQLADCVHELHELIASGPKRYPNGAEHDYVALRTLLPVETMTMDEEHKSWSQTFDAFKYWMAFLGNEWQSFHPLHTGSECKHVHVQLGDAKMRTFGDQAHAFCLSRKRARRHLGYVGQFPLRTQVGDFVFLPLGATMPLIFRLVNDDSMLYKHVGKCYVYGLMKGEPYHMGFREQEIQLI